VIVSIVAAYVKTKFLATEVRLLKASMAENYRTWRRSLCHI